MTRAMPPSFRLLRRNLAAAFLPCLLALTGLAVERDYSLNDKTSEELQKIKPLTDAKNWDAGIAVLDAQLPKVEAKSFDAAIILQVKGQLLLQKGDYPAAIEPLERAVALSDAQSPTYFEEKATLEIVYYLSQLYYQEATTVKNPVLVASYYDKAEQGMSRWVKTTKKPTVESLMFYASLLYNHAVQNQDHPDNEMVKRALEQTDAAFHLGARPKDNLYLLKLACLQQLNRNAEAAEYLELLVKQKPEVKNYWQQLAAIYLTQTQDIRAILAMERAQTYGHMNSSKDQFNLIGLYFNIGQFEHAAELLETGLKNGVIENETKNWELLAYSYQQLHREFKAIEMLKDATKVLSRPGQIYYQIAQIYYSLDKADDSIANLQLCVSHGGSNKPHQAYLFLAYLGYEQKKFDLALEAANKALAFPEGVKEAAKMKSAIVEAIKEREAKLGRF